MHYKLTAIPLFTDKIIAAYSKFLSEKENVQNTQNTLVTAKLQFRLETTKKKDALALLCTPDDFRFIDLNPKYTTFFEAAHTLANHLSKFQY